VYDWLEMSGINGHNLYKLFTGRGREAESGFLITGLDRIAQKG